MQTFHALSLYSLVLAMHGLFLHYFCRRPQDKTRWISLIWIPKGLLFYTFTSSYKNFKIGYFTITIWPVIGKNFSMTWWETLCFPSTDNNAFVDTTSIQRSFWRPRPRVPWNTPSETSYSASSVTFAIFGTCPGSWGLLCFFSSVHQFLALTCGFITCVIL